MSNLVLLTDNLEDVLHSITRATGCGAIEHNISEKCYIFIRQNIRLQQLDEYFTQWELQIDKNHYNHTERAKIIEEIYYQTKDFAKFALTLDLTLPHNILINIFNYFKDSGKILVSSRVKNSSTVYSFQTIAGLYLDNLKSYFALQDSSMYKYEEEGSIEAGKVAIKYYQGVYVSTVSHLVLDFELNPQTKGDQLTSYIAFSTPNCVSSAVLLAKSITQVYEPQSVLIADFNFESIVKNISVLMAIVDGVSFLQAFVGDKIQLKHL